MQDRQVGVDIDFGVDNDVENVETVSFSYLEKKPFAYWWIDFLGKNSYILELFCGTLGHQNGANFRAFKFSFVIKLAVSRAALLTFVAKITT